MSATATHHEHAGHHDHHEMPTGGRELWLVSISATLHCLTGCAIGEIVGMVIGTAAGLSNGATIAISVALAFLFGYGLTSLPLLRAGFTLAAVIPIALASDTLSIATMEIVDNLVIVVIPGALHAGLDTLLFWGSLSFSLVIAFMLAVPVNRWLLARGKGHAVVHETGVHGGPPVRVVAIAVAIAAVFGTAVLVNEAVSESGGGHGMARGESAHGGSTHGAEAETVRGLAVSDGDLTLRLAHTEIAEGRPTTLSFAVTGADGKPVRDFEVEHERRMHFIVVRRDLSTFQHLHPTLAADGTWRTRIKLAEAGSYRAFADFKRDGENHTLGADLNVDGDTDWKPLPQPSNTAMTSDGYDVRMSGTDELAFAITRAGKPVTPEPYLGANGHLVALREGDLAFLHVHPQDGRFMTEFPTPGRYRLFLQFKHEGRVHTAAFTRTVGN